MNPNIISQPRAELYTTPILYNNTASFFWLVFSMIILLLIMLYMVVMIISWWKVFTKAGQPGWAALVPFYNTFLLIEISGKPGWWLIFFFLPILNIIFTFIIFYELSKAFGKGVGFMLGLYFLGIIFWPILAFGKAEYTAPAPNTPSTPAAPTAE